MRSSLRLVPVLVVAGVVAVVGWASSDPHESPNLAGVDPTDGVTAAEHVDALLAERWTTFDLEPAARADDLTVLRRLSLALHGTIPSLSEIREFEADTAPDRLAWWTSRMLEDARFANYFARRLSRGFVGAEDGQFIVFRRDRFEAWLAERLRENTPYDEIVRSMVAERGLWTSSPATNFVTAALADDDIDYNELAGRSVRVFLGQRIDCAQCHDHPFDDWKQSEFEGLAAYFGKSEVSIVGISDNPDRDYQVEDRITTEMRSVEPGVPFHPEWLPESGTPRERLAAWLTHAENVRFERATVNRVWGLMFGKPYSAGSAFTPHGRPVDDLPDPPSTPDADVLAVLGAEFRESGYDLKHLIRAIAATNAFRAESRHPTEDEATYERVVGEWGVFPLVRLRPEQIIGAMLQAASVSTIDQDSHLLVRVVRFFRENNFVNEYGDLGENELEEHSGTIPQALLRMNGGLPNEVLNATPFTASGRLSAFAGDDDRLVETVFLVCLTRRPTEEEREHFVSELNAVRNGNQRARVVEDLYWTLFNTEEFSWNH